MSKSKEENLKNLEGLIESIERVERFCLESDDYQYADQFLESIESLKNAKTATEKCAAFHSLKQALGIE